MNRNPNTNRHGKDFSKEEELQVWRKAQIIPDHNPNEIRQDKCGAIIHFKQYGNTNSKYGWEIDHIKPVSKGGGDEIENLQPLHWRNNRSKSDDPDIPNEYCEITS